MGRARFMNPHRLLAAADSLLEAMESGGAARPPFPRAESDPPEERTDRTRVFTQTEMNEAMSLLVRMGLVRSVAAVDE